MTDPLFDDRRRALEEEHFQKLNAALIARLREERREADQVRELSGATGIEDPALLDELAKLGFTPETLPALAVAPLFEVAWTDGRVDDSERRAILADPGVASLDPAGAAHAMVDGWLIERPAGSVFATWWELTRAACGPLAPEDRLGLEQEMLRRATIIAKASGGFLGFGSPASPEEHVALERVRAAYRG